jgi:hypothetical protein
LNELESISQIFGNMNIQYNFETLKNCARDNLACLEKEDVLHPNFEELIKTIRTF